MQTDDRSGLLEFLKRNRDRTLAEWENTVRTLPAATRLDLEALRDHIPALLDRIVEAVEGKAAEQRVDDLPEEHAAMRLDQGYSLGEIANEYQVLRSALFRLMASGPAPLEAGALLLLNEAIDHAVARALARYHEARSRTLQALERISQEAFASNRDEVRDFLHRFLAVIVDTTEPVDTAVMYLRQWDRLVVRAAVGLESGLEDQFALRVGEGIAGTVAATRRPYFTPDAAHDPLTRNPSIVKAGVKALYAVPLLLGDDLIGVAKMGSRTAASFCQDDRQLFQDMAQRAAVVIAHRRLAEEREMFLGIVGHDLRTPLSTIVMGAAHLRKREKLSDAGERVVERIASASQRIENMIAGLADYTKVRFGGGFQMEPHVIDLGEVVRELVGELAGQHPDRPIRLDVKGDVVGEWDRVRLGQAVSNLVNNALSYGDPHTPITITLDGSDEAAVTLAVHDQGPPIPQGLRPHLFEAFRRGRTERQGMGLGLYVVQHVAHAHGGSVAVDSSAERGTTFTLRLPRWGTGQRR